jgi:hypothetical protein
VAAAATEVVKMADESIDITGRASPALPYDFSFNRFGRRSNGSAEPEIVCRLHG